MLTAEIKINNDCIARITAQNIKTISDKPGDFIGDRATICEYECSISADSPRNWAYDNCGFTIIHDRRAGWQGLLAKICEKATPMIVETISAEEKEEKGL